MSPSGSTIRVVPAAGKTAPGVGKYRYIALIAEGGMADVYLAVTKETGRFEKLVVIKQLRDSLADDPSFVAMFMDEARLAARLNHPNVVQANEVGTANAGPLEGASEPLVRHFIAMEYIEGVPYVRLARSRDRIPAPLAFHVRVLCDALYGLHYAHELKDFDGKPLHVVHRDVSPQNLMLTFAGGVKVLDFGIAKAGLAAEQRPDDFKGKLEYMAPEQALLEPVDRRADIFSVGVMLWEAIAKRRLYVKGEDKFARLVSGEIPDVVGIKPDAPRRLAQICMRALARNPEDRFATALEMAQELDEYLESTSQRVGSREVGAYVAEKFASTRAKLNEAIDAQLRLFRSLPDDDPAQVMPLSRIAVGTDPPPPNLELDVEEPPTDPSPPPMMMGAPPAAPYPQASSGSLSASPLAGASAPSVWTREGPPHDSFAPAVPQTPVAPPLRKRSAALAVGLAAFFGVLVLAAGAATMKWRHSRAIATNPTNSAPSVAASPPADIEFTVRASPPNAVIFVDGQQEAQNPATGTRHRDGAIHVVRVEAAGYEPKEEQLPFDRSFLLTLELRPATPAPAPAATPSASGSAKKTKGLPPRPAGGPQRGTPTRVPTPTNPGAIDTDNPY